MAEAKYLRTRRSVTVKYRDGRTVAHSAGDVIDVSRTHDSFQSQHGSSERTKGMFENASQKDYDEFQGKPRYGSDDPAVSSMEVAAAMTRERAAAGTPEERLGGAGDPNARVPVMGDPGRTLPESGADMPANAKYAAGIADTSEQAVSRELKFGDTPEAKGRVAKGSGPDDVTETHELDHPATQPSGSPGGEAPAKGGSK